MRTSRAAGATGSSRTTSTAGATRSIVAGTVGIVGGSARRGRHRCRACADAGRGKRAMGRLACLV
ncbi:MAG TPA: hypothetical protein VN813_01975 [Luteibacter sp.]|nr:hypothetical protein [Luteibacter sp.]